jgi:hypothetical protein
MIVGDAQLESSHNRIQSGRLVAPRATRWDVGVADDSPKLNQGSVTAQVVPLENDLKRAFAVFVGVLRTAHVEGVAI